MSTPLSRPFFRIADIATTAELLAAGLSADQIRRRAQRGELLPLGRGVYASGARAWELLKLAGGEQLLRVAAAAAVMGPDAVVSHQSAAFVHSIDVLGTPAADVTLTCPRRRGWRSRIGMRLHAAELPSEHVLLSPTGLRLTTPARTVIDLSCTLDFRSGVVAADSALHRKLTTKDELRGVLAACRRRSGIGQAEAVVDFADGYEVLHFDWPDITENPAYVAASVRTAFRRGLRLQARPDAAV